MKIGDRYYMHGTGRKLTITGIGSQMVFYLFDDEAKEDSMPYEEFGWWFSPQTMTDSKVSAKCDCGGYTAYNSYEDLYHSYWCNSQKGIL